MKKLNPDSLSVVFALAVTAAVVLCIYFTSRRPDTSSGLTLTPEELALIDSQDSLMRVFTVADTSDVRVLRTISRDFSAADLLTEAYSRLCTLMVATVTSPAQDGVGIAGPQVGLDRRVVAVQRFDKEGFPFEVYANIRIEEVHGEMVEGQEGCLSVPGMRGVVMRYPEIVISYVNVDSLRASFPTASSYGQGPEHSKSRKYTAAEALSGKIAGVNLADYTVQETVGGFSAIIFQHETDHLDGILYTDKVVDGSFACIAPNQK